MTLKDLKRYLEKHNDVNDLSITDNDNDEEIKSVTDKYSIFKDKPFWINDIIEHKKADIANKGACCFNHIIGLPQKDGTAHKIYDYELQVVNALEDNSDVLINKARGLGITELILRYMAFLAVKDSTYNNCRFHIITGPSIKLAQELIDRLFDLFLNYGIQCDKTVSTINIDKTIIQAFPSHTVYSSRGYTQVKFIFVDEADFFPPSQIDEVRNTCEGYRGKTQPKIVIVSTPNKPAGLLDQLEREPDSPFTKMKLHYSVGLGKIYNPADIEKERARPYFKREYCNYYAYGTGNVFLTESLDKCEQLGCHYKDVPYNSHTAKSMGIDVGYGSSKTAFTIIELVDGIVRIIYSKQFASSSTDEMVRHAHSLMADYGFLDANSDKVFANCSFQPKFCNVYLMCLNQI